jgi:hypothetical protein
LTILKWLAQPGSQKVDHFFSRKPHEVKNRIMFSTNISVKLAATIPADDEREGVSLAKRGGITDLSEMVDTS